MKKLFLLLLIPFLLNGIYSQKAYKVVQLLENDTLNLLVTENYVLTRQHTSGINIVTYKYYANDSVLIITVTNEKNGLNTIWHSSKESLNKVVCAATPTGKTKNMAGHNCKEMKVQYGSKVFPVYVSESITSRVIGCEYLLNGNLILGNAATVTLKAEPVQNEPVLFNNFSELQSVVKLIDQYIE